MAPLTRAHLTAIAVASLRNAKDLVDDAELLLAAGRHSRAHALAVLALEEFGKHVMAVAAVTRSTVERDYWEKFPARFNSHREKLRNARIMIQALRASDVDEQLAALDDLVSEANADQVAKLRGFYVDYDHDGRVLDPRVITASQAEAVTADVRLVLTTLGNLDWASVSERHVDEVRKLSAALHEGAGPMGAAMLAADALRTVLRASDAEAVTDRTDVE